MPKVTRKSDVVEVHSENLLMYLFGVIGCGILAFLFWRYSGSSGVTTPLAIVLGLIAVAFFGAAFMRYRLIRKVSSVQRTCPYCQALNELVEDPQSDFVCSGCDRLIPVKDGVLMEIAQVRCGFCNTLNYYSDKTDVLLCEECNHEVPISHEDGHVAKKKLATGYAVEDDDRPYELVLIAHGPKTDDLVAALQHMLALNRNQVKQMLDELPVTILTGIPKRKAEMLKAQLAIHEAAADARPLSETAV